MTESSWPSPTDIEELKDMYLSVVGQELSAPEAKQALRSVGGETIADHSGFDAAKAGIEIGAAAMMLGQLALALFEMHKLNQQKSATDEAAEKLVQGLRLTSEEKGRLREWRRGRKK